MPLGELPTYGASWEPAEILISKFGCGNAVTNPLVMPKRSQREDGMWPWASWE